MNWRKVALLGLPVVIALALFANTLSGDFVFDDTAIIRDNPTIRSMADPFRFFHLSYWEHTGRNSGLYRPVTMLSYALNYAAGGLRPAGYHAVNMLLHALNSFLVTVLVLHLSRSAAAGCIAGVFFAVHPIHAEAVANVVGRAELLAACFVLLALLLYVAAVGSVGGKRGRRLVWLSSVSYGISLLCKENAITFLALPVIYDTVFRSKGSSIPGVLRSRMKLYAGFVGVSVLYLVLRGAAVGSIFLRDIPSVDNPLVDASVVQRLLTPFAVAGRYATLMFWPVNLSADYGLNAFPVVGSVVDGRFVVGFLFGCLVIAGLVYSFPRSKPVVFLLLFGLCTYSVASNTVVLIGTIVAERLFYLVSVGFCGLGALAVVYASDRFASSPSRTRILMVVITVVLTVPLAALTHMRNADWGSALSLFTTDVKRFPESAKLNFNAGLVLLKAEKAKQSIPYFEACIRVQPSSERGLIHLGKAYGALGEDETRRTIYRQAVQRFGETKHTLPAVAFLHMQDKEYEKARVKYTEALAEDPTNEQARMNLGLALYNLGDYEGAVRRLKRAEVRYFPPDERQRLLYLGLSLYNLGQFDRALRYLRKGKRLFPDHLDFVHHEHVVLGREAMVRKDFEEAILHFEEALSLDPDSVGTSHFLGLAHHNLGHAKEAVDILLKHEETTGSASRDRALALGMSLTKLKRFQEAAQVYRDALESLGPDADVLERLAFVEYTNLKDYGQALGHYELLLESAPNHPQRDQFERVVGHLRRRVSGTVKKNASER